MAKILFLDDSELRIEWFHLLMRKAPNDTYVIVRTADEAILALKSDVYDVVSLDHDLGGQIYQSSVEKNCGMEVVRWIIDNLPPIGKIVIHSYNVPAAMQMRKMLYGVGYDVIQKPFLAK